MFRKELRWACLKFVRNESYTYNADKSLERMLNEAKQIETYIREGKVPPWRDAEANTR